MTLLSRQANSPRRSSSDPDDRLSIRVRILAAAAKVFFTQGFSKARISQIIVQSGVSRSSVYSNFSGKEDILVSLNDWLTEEGAEFAHDMLMGESSAQEGIRLWLHRTLHLEERYKNLIRILHQEDETPNRLLDRKETLAKFRTGLKWVKCALMRGINDGEFRSDIDIDNTARTLQNLHHILGLIAAQQHPLIDFRSEDGDLLVEHIVAGLLKRPSERTAAQSKNTLGHDALPK